MMFGCRLLGNKVSPTVHFQHVFQRQSSVGRGIGRLSNSAAYSTMAEPVITIDNMNPDVKKLEYAVRGPLVIRATAIEKELAEVSD